MVKDYISIVVEWGEFSKECSDSENWSEFEEDVLTAFKSVASIPKELRNKFIII